MIFLTTFKHVSVFMLALCSPQGRPAGGVFIHGGAVASYSPFAF